MSAKNPMMYDTNPAVAELNKVPGFDPKKFLRKTKNDEMVLDLKYKKLWFRLKHPSGRIKVSALKITEQIAIIEAKIFFDKRDPEPDSSYIAQRNARDGQGQLYIEAAQYAAVDQALEDAGFGLQLCDGKKEADPEPRRAEEINPPVIPTAQQAAEELPAQAIPDPKEPPAEDSVPESQPDAASQPEVEVPADIPELPAEEMPPAETAEREDEIADAQQPDEPVTAQAAYTIDTPVDEICAVMTIEEAEAVIVDTGTCKDWQLGQVAEKRPASLKWYLNGYPGPNNILRAGATLLLNRITSKNAA